MKNERSKARYRSRRPSVGNRFAQFATFAGEASWQFWLLAVFLCAAFALGGGSRLDVESLIVLRPLSAIVLAIACLTLQPWQIAQYRYLFLLAFACVVLVGAQLVPLPAHMFPASSARALVAAIDSASGLGAIARPLSLSPPHTWNALWATMAPIAVLMLGAQLDSNNLRSLLPVVLVLGLVSAGLSMIQVFSDPNSGFYLYKTPHVGTPIGLFANRNHNAVFLASLLPMLVVWAEQRSRRHQPMARSRGTQSHTAADFALKGDRIDERNRPASWRRVVAGAIGLALLPVILDTGSRTGLAIAALACLCIPLLRRRDPDRRARKLAATPGISVSGIIASSRRFVPLIAPLAGLLIVGSALWLGRADSISRLLGQDATRDMRFQILPTVKAIIAQLWPLGSGAGTFSPVYRAFEPDSMLSPLSIAQANNDWLEVALMAGLPGVVLLAFAVVLWLARARALLFAKSHGLQFSRLGLLIILFFGLASLTDYPLRVPSISCLIVVAALWCVMRQDEATAMRPSDRPGR